MIPTAQVHLECHMRRKMELGHVDGYDITYKQLTHRSKAQMASTVRSTATTSMQNHRWPQTSLEARGSQTTTCRCSFQSSAADTLSTMPWESWVTWDLLQKSTGSVPTKRSAPASAENRTPSMPSFYKQRQHTPSPSTTLLGPMAPPMSEPKFSVSPSTTQNPVLDPVLPPLPPTVTSQGPDDRPNHVDLQGKIRFSRCKGGGRRTRCAYCLSCRVARDHTDLNCD
jgi:hypothetical protein